MSMKERVIALGFFDGVHLGHGALLRRTVEAAGEREDILSSDPYCREMMENGEEGR